MNSLLICDNCHEPFDIVPKSQKAGLPPIAGGPNAPPEAHLDLTVNRVPMNLRSCGHTLCSVCINGLLTEAEALRVVDQKENNSSA